MITENLSTLKINKLTRTQYERELAAGRIDASALYLTPEEDSAHTHETADGGSAHGTGASATYGGAIGYNATTTVGGAVGRETSSTSGGGAIGAYASTTFGGAVGFNAKSTSGFSGGNGAKSEVNAIQLGVGTNSEENSLQVYDKKLMNGNGYIPFARYAKFVQGTTAYTLSQGTKSNSHKVYAESSTSLTNPGSVIIIPVIRYGFDLVASMRYHRGETYIVVSRSEGADSTTYSDYYVDYWILSEKPV